MIDRLTMKGQTMTATTTRPIADVLFNEAYDVWRQRESSPNGPGCHLISDALCATCGDGLIQVETRPLHRVTDDGELLIAKGVLWCGMEGQGCNTENRWWRAAVSPNAGEPLATITVEGELDRVYEVHDALELVAMIDADGRWRFAEMSEVAR